MKITPVEFWFDFSSPYGYLAAMTVEKRIEAYGRRIVWRPFLLGAAFQITGSKPLSETPLRGDYARYDCARLAKLLGLPFQFPPPYRSQIVARTYYWLEENKPDLAISFAKSAFRAHFAFGLDLSRADLALQLARQAIGDIRQLENWLASEEAKEKLKQVTSLALSRGVFGSPFFFVDNQPFWGWDRLGMLEAWLQVKEWNSQLASKINPLPS